MPLQNDRKNANTIYAEYINPRINIRFNYRLIDYYCVNIQNIRADGGESW